jgi:hypothetical protein
MRTTRLPIHRRFKACCSTWWPILSAFVRVVTRRRIPKRSTSWGTLFFSWTLRVQVILLRILLIRLGWHILQLSLHGGGINRSNFGHLRNDILSLSFRCLVSFWVQNLFYRHLRNCVFIWKFLPVLLILLPFMMIVYYLGSHVWNMRSTLSIRLFIRWSHSRASFTLSVGIVTILLSHISLTI